MLLNPVGNKFHWKYTNWGSPAVAPGTSVVPGASNAEGAWTQIATAANIAQDVYAVTVQVSAGATSANQKDHLLDIGVDPAGGTSYAAIINNIVCGQSDIPNRAPKNFFFPIFIKAGSSVAVRIQGSNATAGTVRVAIIFYGQPSNPEAVLVGQYSETVGAITGSAGVSFTPVNGSEGAWASLGTTTRPCWWWQLGVQVSNGTIVAQVTHVDLAYGDGTNMVMIIENLVVLFNSTDEAQGQMNHRNLVEAFCEVPAGATLYVRGWCSTTPASGYNAVAVGIGG